MIIVVEFLLLDLYLLYLAFYSTQVKVVQGFKDMLKPKLWPPTDTYETVTFISLVKFFLTV